MQEKGRFILLHSFYVGTGMNRFPDQDPGSRIQDKHPGSTTPANGIRLCYSALYVCSKLVVTS
jgi:hypothetical protein